MRIRAVLKGLESWRNLETKSMTGWIKTLILTILLLYNKPRLDLKWSLQRNVALKGNKRSASDMQSSLYFIGVLSEVIKGIKG